MSTLIPQAEALEFMLNATPSIFDDWKQLIPTEKAQAIFCANMTNTSYAGQFHLQEIFFGSTFAEVSSLLYGVTYFYFDALGNILIDAALLNAPPNIQNPVNRSSIPNNA